AAALAGHPPGARFVLLDDRPIALDAASIGGSASVVAIGLAESEPAIAPIDNPGLTLRPLAPVHPRRRGTSDGGLVFTWTRRARGAWSWPNGIETPLNEQTEGYLVGLGVPQAPDLAWETSQPRLELSASQWAVLAAEHAGKALWVRQLGSFDVSDPLLLASIA